MCSWLTAPTCCRWRKTTTNISLSSSHLSEEHQQTKQHSAATETTATICAISTPHGVGGIAVIRLSGNKAVSIADRLFRGRHPLADAASHTAHFGEIIGDQEQVIDEVVCTVFRAPHSFTGEDTVEISCHGSLFIQQEIIRLLTTHGARIATPGEFTKRAFLNGRLDLSQAEAVADLIAAQSAAEKDLALRQMRGGVRETVKTLREALLRFTALLELELDFADHEDLEFADRHELSALLSSVRSTIAALLQSFSAGNAIKQGIHVAIVGAPNAGKSTLLNALLGEERAIVSAEKGTTRDTIDDTLFLDGHRLRLTDTAGIRETDNDIERQGVERSLKAIHEAHIIIELIDASEPVPPQLTAYTTTYSTVKPHLLVYNKADIATPQLPDDAILISAKNGDITPLLERLRHEVAMLTGTSGLVLISNTRHYDALKRADEALTKVEEGLLHQLSGELLALDLHDALDALGEITGEVTSDEVLSTIFASFCIGK